MATVDEDNGIRELDGDSENPITWDMHVRIVTFVGQANGVMGSHYDEREQWSIPFPYPS